MAVNRTLVVPPFRLDKLNIPFEQWFDLPTLSAAHRVVTAKAFMKHLAKDVWPLDQRIGLCYASTNTTPCDLKKGQAFKSFWDSVDVDFVRTESYSTHYKHTDWFKTRFPPSKYPVLALRTPPASFPMAERDVSLQKFLRFDEEVDITTNSTIKRLLGGVDVDFIGVHLRGGKEWTRACDLASGSGAKLMSSYQCVGFNYRQPSRALTREMCEPSSEEIVRTITTAVDHLEIHRVVLASNDEKLAAKTREALVEHYGEKVEIHISDAPDPIVDLALLSRSTYFIGNCVSSFSGFVWRQREEQGLGRSGHFAVEGIV